MAAAVPMDQAEGVARWNRALRASGNGLLVYTDADWQFLHETWITEVAEMTDGELDSEYAHALRRIAEIRLTWNPAEQAIQDLTEVPQLTQRADYLTAEIRRRRSYPAAARVAGVNYDDALIRKLKLLCDVPKVLEQWGWHGKHIGHGMFLGLCPMHTEHTPSFRVQSDRWHCFGACNQGGDVFDLLIAAGECRTWPQAVRWVADRARVDLPEAPKPQSSPTGVVSRGGVQVA